jgi:hypothetical protein
MTYKISFISALIFFFCFTEFVSGQFFTSSNLPIMVINTNGQTIQDEPKIIASMGIIDHKDRPENKITDPFNGYNGRIGIEIRGSSSQMFPKKGYGFETRKEDGSNNNVSLMGMPQENDWVLHGPYSDKSLIRNMLCYILAGDIMEYAPRGRYCELVINGIYQGVYVLMEKIKRDKNRVNIAEISPTDNTGDRLTGGYIIKIDKETGSDIGGWTSTFKPIPNQPQITYFQYDYPKASDITPNQKVYIQQFIRLAEESINAANYDNPAEGYRKFVDDKSLVDYIIMNELSKNVDAYRLSTYLYKDRDSRGGKLKFGPVWDYNLGFGNVNYCTNGNPEGLVITDFNQVCSQDWWVIHFWWKKFMADQQLKSDMKNRWQNLRSNKLSDQRVFFVVDSLTNLLSKAQVRNFQKWPVLNEYVWPNYVVTGSYQGEIQFLKNWLRDRLLWLDQEFGSYITVNTKDDRNEIYAEISPNPVHQTINIHCPSCDAASGVSIRNVTGQVLRQIYPFTDTANFYTMIDVSYLVSGLYFMDIGNTAGTKRAFRFVKI